MAAAPEENFGAVARQYADFMLAQGRDRYGEAHSPLFAGSLLIKDPAGLLPDAIYGDKAKRQDVRVVQNLPNIYKSGNLAHKITYRGGDLADDVGLLRLLYRLTERTGDRRYAAAADDAVRWFLANCIVKETGLPAWGEHSGWDFRRERADRTDPPYQHHEFDSDWPFYDRLVALQPRVERGQWTVLENWSKALWEGAVFEKQGRLMYCRHSALFERGRPAGGEYSQYGMFPRHGGYYVKHWAISIGASKNKSFVDWMTPRLERFIAMLEEQVRTAGYPDYEEKGKALFFPDQIAEMATHLEESARRLPRLASRLRTLAERCDAALAAKRAPLAAGEAIARWRADPEGPNADYFEAQFMGTADRLASLVELPERELASKGKQFNQAGRIPEQYAEAIDVLLAAAELKRGDGRHAEAAQRFGREA
nr:hypothetical protein [Bryobacter sp.]